MPRQGRNVIPKVGNKKSQPEYGQRGRKTEKCKTASESETEQPSPLEPKIKKLNNGKQTAVSATHTRQGKNNNTIPVKENARAGPSGAEKIKGNKPVSQATEK